MAIGVIADFEGGNLNHYFQTNASLNFKRARQGALTHWVTQTDTAFRVCDAWESREDLRGTWEEGPHVLKLISEVVPGMTPNIKIYELHDIQREPPVRESAEDTPRDDIGVIMTFAGGTVEQYDELKQKLAMPAAAPGRISHWVAKTDEGVLICDCWESGEAYTRAVQEQIVPASEDIFPSKPQIELFEAHHSHGLQDLPRVPAARKLL